MSVLGDVIDRLIQFIERRERLDRELYEDRVVPLMTAVDALHGDYLQAFRRYRDAIAAKVDLPTLIQNIGTDSLFSRDSCPRSSA